ncbi:MAG: hypothetical protein WCL08_12100 [Verrucomicrobiota bacterium]
MALEQIVLVLPPGLEQDLIVLANEAAKSKGLLDIGNGTGRDFAGAASEIKRIITKQGPPQYQQDAVKQIEDKVKLEEAQKAKDAVPVSNPDFQAPPSS